MWLKHGLLLFKHETLNTHCAYHLHTAIAHGALSMSTIMQWQTCRQVSIHLGTRWTGPLPFLQIAHHFKSQPPGSTRTAPPTYQHACMHAHVCCMHAVVTCMAAAMQCYLLCRHSSHQGIYAQPAKENAHGLVLLHVLLWVASQGLLVAPLLIPENSNRITVVSCHEKLRGCYSCHYDNIVAVA